MQVAAKIFPTPRTSQKSNAGLAKNAKKHSFSAGLAASAFFFSVSLLCAKRLKRIDTRCAARWDQRRDKRDRQQQPATAASVNGSWPETPTSKFCRSEPAASASRHPIAMPAIALRRPSPTTCRASDTGDAPIADAREFRACDYRPASPATRTSRAPRAPAPPSQIRRSRLSSLVAGEMSERIRSSDVALLNVADASASLRADRTSPATASGSPTVPTSMENDSWGN